MKTTTIKRDFAKQIESIKQAAANGKNYSAGAVLDARRMIEVADIAESMTSEEWERIHQIPVWTNDVRCLADIKAKYRLSWNELRTLRMVER